MDRLVSGSSLGDAYEEGEDQLLHLINTHGLTSRTCSSPG